MGSTVRLRGAVPVPIRMIDEVSASLLTWEMLIERLSGVASARYLGHVRCERLNHQSH